MYFSVFHHPSALKKSISQALCSTSPKAYLPEVRVEWHFLVRLISCNDLNEFDIVL